MTRNHPAGNGATRGYPQDWHDAPPLVDPKAGERYRAQLIERGLLVPRHLARSAWLEAQPCLLLDDRGRFEGQREAEEYLTDVYGDA